MANRIMTRPLIFISRECAPFRPCQHAILAPHTYSNLVVLHKLLENDQFAVENPDKRYVAYARPYIGSLALSVGQRSRWLEGRRAGG